jgi:hypothetical protein
MKKILFTAITITILFSACQKNHSANEKSSNGIITGMDPRKCACCWGWIIEIDNTVYKFEKIPARSTIDLNNLSYPANVIITWRDSQGSCSGRLIEVLSISQ